MYIILASLLWSLTFGSLAATTPRLICTRPVDVIFVLDGSDSIDDISMTRMKQFVIDFASVFMTDAHSADFGSVMYSSNVAGVVPLRRNISLFQFTESVRSLPHPKDGTNTDIGINKMRKMFAVGGRPGVPMSGIVITDGRSKLQNRTAIESRLARTQGIQMIAIGIGYLIDRKELESIANIGNVMTVASFLELQSLIEQLHPRVCPPLPTTTTTTTITITTTLAPTPTTTTKPPPPTTTTTTTKLPPPTTTTTTTKPPPPLRTIPTTLMSIRNTQVYSAVEQAPDGICNECVIVNGVGYTNHPLECSLYIQCFFLKNIVKSVIRQCSFGLFWDQKELTCKLALQVQCKTDQCRNETVASYPYYKNCRYYWACEEGMAVAKCCPEGHAYTAGRGCVRDTSCQQRCTFEETKKALCNTKSYPRDNTFYQEYVVGQGWIKRQCPPGTTYLLQTCSCSQFGINLKQFTCIPEILMLFNGTSAKDESRNRIQIGNEGVVICHGVAFFNGHSRLLLWRFSNSPIGNVLLIRFRFKLKSLGHQNKQALISNGGCTEKPSVYIVANTFTNQLEMGAVTPLGISQVNIRFEPNQWYEVTYLFESDRLTASVGNLVARGQTVGRTVINKHCPLQIGAGLNYENFQGAMDDISIFLCRP